MEYENLIQAKDRFSTNYYGLSTNDWGIRGENAHCILRVSGDFFYDHLSDILGTIPKARADMIWAFAVGGDEMGSFEESSTSILADMDASLKKLRRSAQTINSYRDFKGRTMDRPSIFSLNGAAVFFSPGEGLLDFMYADFDTPYRECMESIKKAPPTQRAELDLSALSDKERTLYYYFCLIQTYNTFRPLIEASVFSAEYPPVFFHCDEAELTDYYHYLKAMQTQLLEITELVFNDELCDGFYKALTHKSRYVLYCRKHGISPDRSKTTVSKLSLFDAQNELENALDEDFAYSISSDEMAERTLRLRMSALSEVSDSVQESLNVLGLSMGEYTAITMFQAWGNDDCVCESIEKQIEFEVMYLLEHEIGMRKCKRCGRYFMMKGNYDTNYCDRVAEGETKNCQQLAAQENYKRKMADNAAIPMYQKYYKRYAARVRVHQIKPDDFKKWKYEALTRRNECTDGKITLDELEAWMEGSFPNRQQKS